MIEVEIDNGSGFCFGVVNAIKSAEKELGTSKDNLYCLGDIVHNNQEVERLKTDGLHSIVHEDLPSLQGKKVLLRAHGEPPSTYQIAKENNITIIDATCPVVLRLQQRILKCYLETRTENAQIVIYGKKGHAEVNGLVGQTEGNAIVVEHNEDIQLLDFTRDIYLFSQTTKPLEGFHLIIENIRSAISPDAKFTFYDTICRQVTNRMPNIKVFASNHDWIYFVAGKKSSNGKVLFEECKKANPNTQFVSDAEEIIAPLPADIKRVGVCGATSTPKWQMEAVAERVRQLNKG